MATYDLAQNLSLNNGDQRPEIDVCITSGSIAVLPLSDQAKSYCGAYLAGWRSVRGIFFVPRRNADIVLQKITRRYCCRVDGEIVS